MARRREFSADPFSLFAAKILLLDIIGKTGPDKNKCSLKAHNIKLYVNSRKMP